VTFILKFGGDLSGKFQRRVGTETTWLDLERPSRLSRLNGGDSQVYAQDLGEIPTGSPPVGAPIRGGV